MSPKYIPRRVMAIEKLPTVSACRKLVGDEYAQFENMEGRLMQFVISYALQDFSGEFDLCKRLYPENDNDSNYEFSRTILSDRKVLDLMKVVVLKLIEQRKSVLEAKIVNMLYAQAFYDPKHLINAEGQPAFEKMEDLAPELRCCIERIETKFFGKNCEEKISTVILCDRHKALDKLGKYLAMFTPEGKDMGPKIINNEINMNLRNVLINANK